MGADFKTGASLAGKILTSGQVPGTAATTVYTVPAASAVKVATAALYNTTASTVTVTVSVVPSGQAVDGTRVIASCTLIAKDSTNVTELANALLDTGAVISLTSDTATAINYLITGVVSS